MSNPKIPANARLIGHADLQAHLTPTIFDELVALTAKWKRWTVVSDAEKQRAIEIGCALYEAGGGDLLRDAYYQVKALNRHAVALKAHWRGIGKWKP